jgi:putative redox protein
MTVRWYARKHELPLTRVHVEVVHQAPQGSGADGPSDTFSKKVTVEGSRLTAQQRAKLLEVAAKCPVQKTLERGSRVSTHA